MNRREFMAGGAIAAGAPVWHTAAGKVVETRQTRLWRLYSQGRQRIVYIPAHALEPILDGWARGPQYVSLMVWKNLPTDCLINGVFWSDTHRCFGVYILHEDFSPIERGAEIPALETWNNENIVYEKISDHYRPAGK